MTIRRRWERFLTVSPAWNYKQIDKEQQLALFAAGCFWGVEGLFRNKFKSHSSFLIQAVYAGDDEFDCPITGQLGDHAEAVLIAFNPVQIPYENLVSFFFKIHDPTERNRQGNDIGRQYRSSIWIFSSEQGRSARTIRDRINLFYEKKVNGLLCSTKILRAPDKIWTAERYHQNFAEANPGRCSHYVRDHIP